MKFKLAFLFAMGLLTFWGCDDGDSAADTGVDTTSATTGTDSDSTTASTAPGTDSTVDTGSATAATADTASETSGDSETATYDVDLTGHTYGPETPQIQYVGRIDFDNEDGPQFSAGGVYIQATFIGTGVTVHLRDERRYQKGNHYDVYIDDMPPVRVKPELRSVTDYPIADDLPLGEHTVMLVKRNEDEIGKGVFKGFTFVGEIQEPAPLPERKIQIFGDSISSGTGVEAKDGSADCNEWEVAMNAHLSFGAVAARALDAQYHVSARAGIGLIQGYDPGAPTMPEVYNLLYMQEYEEGSRVEWDMTSWIPDAVVIALGTNDFSPGAEPPAADTDAVYPRPTPTPEEFATVYTEFVNNLLAVWPNAQIFGVTSQMLGDGWPTAENTYKSDQLAGLNLTAANFTGGNFHIVQIAKQSGKGCGTHPDVAQQAATALELETAIRGVMGW